MTEYQREVFWHVVALASLWVWMGAMAAAVFGVFAMPDWLSLPLGVVLGVSLQRLWG